MRGIRFRGASLVAALALGSASAAYAQSESPAQALLSPFTSSTTIGETAVLMEKGISLARSAQAVAVQAEVEHTNILGQIEAALGGDYGGAWFEPSAAQLHIGVTSPASRTKSARLVAHAGMTASVAYTLVRSTWAQLLAAQRRWNGILLALFAKQQASTGIDSAANAVSVTLSSLVSARELADLRRRAAHAAVNILLDIVAPSQLDISADATTCPAFKSAGAYCSTPLTSGVLITDEKKAQPQSYCTAGPMAIPKDDVKKTYLVTAGHCLEATGGPGKPWYSSTPVPANPATEPAQVTEEIGQSGNYLSNVAGGDYGFIDIKPGKWANALPRPLFAATAQWGQAGTQSVATGEIEPTVVPFVAPGISNCHEGATSGEQCGAVQNTNESTPIKYARLALKLKLVNGSEIIKGIELKPWNKLQDGWFIAGTGIPQGTTIEASPKQGEIKMSNKATMGGEQLLTFSEVTTVNGLVKDSACGEPGDSGGSFLNTNNNELRVDGIDVAGTEQQKCTASTPTGPGTCATCTSYYEPIATALGTEWELLTPKNETRPSDK
jgi:hypothetical protein